MARVSSANAGSTTSGGRVQVAGIQPRSQKTGHDSQWRHASSNRCWLSRFHQSLCSQGMTRSDGSPSQFRLTNIDDRWRQGRSLAVSRGGEHGSMWKHLRWHVSCQTIRVFPFSKAI